MTDIDLNKALENERFRANTLQNLLDTKVFENNELQTRLNVLFEKYGALTRENIDLVVQVRQAHLLLNQAARTQNDTENERAQCVSQIEELNKRIEAYEKANLNENDGA